MVRRIVHVMLMGLLSFNLCGCLALVAGVAGGAGTAVWLSGKLTQEFHAPYDTTIHATHAALHALGLPVVSETQTDNLTQIKATYSDGREMWVDIHHIGDSSTKVEVRVGAPDSDKEAAGMVLRKIQSSF